MRVFVTGATGFLGRHLISALEGAGHDVTGIGSADCNLVREESLRRFREPYDQIWHLAAWTQAGDFCVHHPGEQWIINQRINTNVLDWWQTRQSQARLIAMGTSCSYAPGSELTEDNYMVGAPIPELYSYAMTKRMLLVGLQALATQYGLQYAYLIPNTLYGPGYHTDGRQRHFIFDLINKIVRGSAFGEPVQLWGDGHQKRELVFIKDFVDAAVQLSVTVHNDIVNIGSGTEHSIRWYAEQICGIVGYDPAKIVYDTTRYTGVRSKLLSVRKLRSLLPEFNATPIQSALDLTVRWELRDGAGTVQSSCSVPQFQFQGKR
jgi:GDP-L-fucose synthase